MPDDHIDSDNNAGAYGGPDRTDGEDRIEDDGTLPGKLIAVNDGDSDGDGIPDFADGYDLDKNDFNDIDSAGDRFTPLVLELPAGIDLSAMRVTAARIGLVPDYNRGAYFIPPLKNVYRLFKP